MPYHISYHIISYHISYNIISYHTIYHIISYHIISYHIRSLLLEMYETRKWTLGVRNDYFLTSKHLVYTVTRAPRRKAVRCASLILQAMYPSTHKRHDIAASVRLGAHPYSICKYQFYAIVGRRRGGRSTYENTTNEFQ